MTAVDVVVVAYRSEQSIEACVRAASAVPGVGHVVVVDHGQDRSGDLASSLGATVVTDPSNPGFAAGQNRGVALTTAAYVLLLNPDAIVVPEGVARGVGALDGDSSLAAVQGAIRSARDGDLERSHGVEPGPVHLLGRALGARRLRSARIGRAFGRRLSVLADHVDRETERPVNVEYLAATALLVRRSAFDDVGGFDVGHFLYGEDIDLGRRLRARGWRLLALPEAWALHENGASSSSPADRELHWWRGTMRFAARWWASPAWLVALGAAGIRATTLAATERGRARDAFRMLIWAPMEDRCRVRHRPSTHARAPSVVRR